MEEEDYKKAKKIQDEIIKLTTRYNNITHALERGGCGMKAEISYTPGHCFSKRTAIIFLFLIKFYSTFLHSLKKFYHFHLLKNFLLFQNKNSNNYQKC